MALVAVPRAAIADPPAEDAGGADEHDGEEVEDDCLEGGCWFEILCCGRIGRFWRAEERRCGGEVCAVDAS